MSNENKNRPSSLPRHILGDRELETYLKLIKRDRMRDKGKAKSPPIRKMDFTSQRSNTTKDTIYTPWLTPTIRSGIGFDYNTTSPLEGLAKGAIASILQGVRHISPLDDSYYTTPPGGRTVALSGTLLYVDSNDQTFMVDANRIFGTTTECGYISLLFQGLDISDDGERLYYVMDSSYMKVWYDESDLSLNFNPDAVNNNRVLSITLPSGDGGWFGKGKHEIFISWDFAQQVFELWFDENRATYSVNAGDATKPKFTSTDIITFVNSDPTTDDADAGLLNMYGMIDEIQMVGDFPPLRIITSLDGVVSNSLYPVHSGTQSTACDVASATPINLGTIDHPFDNLVVKTATVLCLLTSPGGGGSGTPSDSVVTETAFDQADTAGVATTYSRGDHTHGTPATPTLTPAGNDTNIQYNNGGSLGGDDDLAWDDSNKRLGVGTTTPSYTGDFRGEDAFVRVYDDGSGGSGKSGFIIRPYGTIEAGNMEWWVFENGGSLLIKTSVNDGAAFTDVASISEAAKLDIAAIETTGDITVGNDVIATGDVSGDDVNSTGKFSGVYINLSNPPRCRAYLSGTQTNIVSATPTTVTLDAETYDSGGIFNTATHVCTPNVAGYYLVTGSIQWSTGTTANKLYMAKIYKNGANAAESVNQTAFVSYITCSVTDIIYFNGTTDYCTLVAMHYAAVDTPDLNNASPFTYLCVHKLS